MPTPSRLALACVAAAATTILSSRAALAGSGYASCRNPGANVMWRVSWTSASSPYGELVTVKKLERQVGTGAWASASNYTWQLRYDDTPDMWSQAFPPSYQEKKGMLATLSATPVATYLSPRVVTPDGYCTNYLLPFANGKATWPAIGVVGDSLTASLNDASYDKTHIQGFVEGNLNSQSLRAEVEGQAGKRWTPDPDKSGLDRSDSTMMDEIRGLHVWQPRGLVIGLGANDAGWAVAFGTTDAEQQSRLNYVLDTLTAEVQEIGSWGTCVTVVTAPDSLAEYWGADPWRYAWAAQTINNRLRWFAGLSSSDWLHLQDFAAESANHHTWNSDVWFGSDNLHFNDVGKLHYTAAIVNAAVQCK